MKKIRSTFLIITFILFLIIVVQTVLAFTHNYNMKKNYSHNPETYDYGAAVRIGNININEVKTFFTTIEALPQYRLTNTINSPVTIRYYDHIGGDKPVYVIKKGDQIHVRNDNNSLTTKVGYGLDSMPTDVKGWRIAYPFATGPIMKNELLYVKMDELRDVARLWVDTNKYIQQRGKQLKITKNELIRRLTLSIDQKLYDHGAYFSADLFVPIFPTSSFILSVLMVLFASISVFLHVKKQATRP